MKLLSSNKTPLLCPRNNHHVKKLLIWYKNLRENYFLGPSAQFLGLFSLELGYLASKQDSDLLIIISTFQQVKWHVSDFFGGSSMLRYDSNDFFSLFYHVHVIFYNFKTENRFINTQKLFYQWKKYQKFMKNSFMLLFVTLKI